MSRESRSGGGSEGWGEGEGEGMDREGEGEDVVQRAMETREEQGMEQ